MRWRQARSPREGNSQQARQVNGSGNDPGHRRRHRQDDHPGLRQRSRPADRPGDESWVPPASPETLLVTRKEPLREEVERIVGAVGGTLRTVADTDAAGPYWDAAAAVLVGSDIREVPRRRKPPAVLIGVAGDAEGLWELAAALGAERVAVLPDAASWLAEFLASSRKVETGGLVLGITGGCGGAGASTAAIWIAQSAARAGLRVVLVDADPFGGGLELAMAAEETPGLRWKDLAGVSGSLDPEQLCNALPTIGGFSFLSWSGSRDRATEVDAATVAGILDAARRGCELVVLDIGRARESLAAYVGECDRLVVIVRAEVRAALATARLLEALPAVDAALVVRGRTGSDIEASLMAEAVGLPLQGIMPELARAAEATEHGRLMEMGLQRSVRRFAAGVLGAGAGAP